MKQPIELTQIPTPASPGVGFPGMSLGKLVEALADVLIEAGPGIVKWEELGAGERQRVLQLEQSMHSMMNYHQRQLQQIADRLASLDQALAVLTHETAKNAEQTARLSQRCDTLTFNLDQVRVLADALVGKQQELADQFIERYVTDHLYKEFLNIQFALMRYSANGTGNLKADIQALAEAVESFLTESGLQVINPAPGSVFEPREHQPVKLFPCGDNQADGTVAETFTPGLSRGRRVIQQARVAVFKADRVKNTK